MKGILGGVDGKVALEALQNLIAVMLGSTKKGQRPVQKRRADANPE